MRKLQKLPVGIQDFRKIQEGGYLYLDKTEYIYNLIDIGEIYFLARPRRFGKTLLVSVMECLFKGERELFKGLWIEDKWDWQKSYPVIRLDMSSVPIRNREEADKLLSNKIESIAEDMGVEIRGDKSSEKFAMLIKKLNKKYSQKVVVLIDEYDSPIIKNLDDIARAKEIREEVRDFYQVLKSEEASLRFIFLTGVSKFSRAGVFSALNNMQDITIASSSSKMLGITQTELEEKFRDYIDVLAEKNKTSREDIIKRVRQWYNGFCFDPEPSDENRVYNPFSTLLLFTQQQFNNYWFESGSPKFLIDLLKSRGYDLKRLDKMEIGGIEFNSYEPEDLKIEALLLQTGYLTLIKRIDERMYEIGYPNKEIKESFNAYLLDAYGVVGRGDSQVYVYKMRKMLEETPPDFDGFIEKINEFLEKIPYDMADRLKDKEQYYQNMLYLIISMLGLEVYGELKIAKGRLDLIFEINRQGFILELKINKGADDAIEQIKQKDYAAVYRGKVEKTYLVGIGISVEERKITDWKLEELS